MSLTIESVIRIIDFPKEFCESGPKLSIRMKFETFTKTFNEE
jgi:hypothetical protein